MHYLHSTWLFLHRSRWNLSYSQWKQVSDFLIPTDRSGSRTGPMGFPPYMSLHFLCQWKWSTAKWFSCNESVKDSIRLFLSYRERSFLQTNGSRKKTYSSKIIRVSELFFDLLRRLLFILRVNTALFKPKKIFQANVINERTGHFYRLQP